MLSPEPPTHMVFATGSNPGWQWLARVFAYALCSSFLLVLNKHVIVLIGSPGTVLLYQCTFTTAFLGLMSVFCRANVISSSANKLLDKDCFVFDVVPFVVASYARMQSLKHANVDTVICLTMTAPVVLSVLEFLQSKERPSSRSLMSLCGIVVSLSAFTFIEGKASNETIAWLSLWYLFLIFEVARGQDVSSKSASDVFESSFYQNLLSVPIVLILVLFTEPEINQTKPWTTLDVFSFIIFCTLGMGTRFFSVDVRKQITVARFMVLGNVCNLSTIFINFFFWERHASEWGTTSIAVGLVWSIVFFYNRSQPWTVHSSIPMSPLPTMSKNRSHTLLATMVISVLAATLLAGSSTHQTTRAGGYLDSSMTYSIDEECWVTQYKTFHNNSVEKLSRGESVQALVYSCESNCGGLGDRISGIISSFYAAVVMKRVFVIDSKHPLPLALTLVPANVDWDISHLLPEKNTKEIYVDAKDSHKRQEPVFSQLFAAHDTGNMIIRLRVNRYHLGMNLWAHKSLNHPYAGEMLRLYRSQCCAFEPCQPPGPATTMRAAFNVLFKFSPAVLKSASDMQQSIGIALNSSSYVALHARIGGQLSSNISWQDPERHGMEDASEFLRCGVATVEEAATNHNATSLPIVVFSDSMEFRKRLANLDTRVKVIQDSVIMHVDRSTNGGEKIMERGLVHTFAELYIISRANCIVGSSSTFSALAGSIFVPAGQQKRCYKHFAECETNDMSFDYWLSEGLR